MIYITADLHFGHKNIIEFCNRPFADVIEMREKMLDILNRRVGQNDELWVIGDFGLHLRTDDVQALLKRLVCKHTRLVMGNHDEKQHGQCFEQFYQAHILKWNHQSFYLSHYPLRSWRQNFQLHGHEHGRMPAMVGQLDVGIDGPRGGWRGDVWSVEEIIEYVQHRDKDQLIRDACKQRHGDRLIVGGYGGKNKLGQDVYHATDGTDAE